MNLLLLNFPFAFRCLEPRFLSRHLRNDYFNASVRTQQIGFSATRRAELERALRAGETVNASVLAERFEVSTKTIHRDCNFIRDNFELPIQFDYRRNTFYLAGTTGKETTP